MTKPKKTSNTKGKTPSPAKARKSTPPVEAVIARPILREADAPPPKASATKSAKEPKAAKPAKPSKPTSKLARLEAMLRQDGGVTIEALSTALAWQAHSVRGAISGALKKRLGLTIESSKDGKGERLYRIVD
jgi:hypothetical protein